MTLRVKYSKDNKKYAYGEKTDVYSFGLLWWQILTKGDPFVPRPDKFKSKVSVGSSPLFFCFVVPFRGLCKNNG